jgi:hypothetical protein
MSHATKNKDTAKHSEVENTENIHRGWISLELMGVMLVVIVAIVGVVAFINSAFSRADITAEMTNINGLFTQAKGLLKSSSGYDFQDAGEMTGDLVRRTGGSVGTLSVHGDVGAGTATLTNAWGGDVTMAPASINSTANAGFSVDYEKVPGDACETLVTKLSRGSMIYSTTINGTEVIGEVSPAKAGKSCQSGLGSSNILLFKSDS